MHSLRGARKTMRVLFVSNYKAETFKDLRSAISELARELPPLRKPVPADYARAALLLENSRQPYVHWTKFAALVGLDPTSPDVADLAQFLHDVGSLIWFKDVRVTLCHIDCECNGA